jgi:adenosylcobinamide-phosphate guanylyltransferase
MCGGAGTRLASAREKPLVRVCGRSMVDRILAALSGSARVDAVFAVTSPQAAATAAHVDVPTIETPGEGYVADLDAALADDRVAPPVATVAADLPLVTAAHLDRVLPSDPTASVTVSVPTATKRALGCSVEAEWRHEGRPVSPTGCNVVAPGSSERLTVARAPPLAVNVNRRSDLRVARGLCLAVGDPAAPSEHAE